MKVISGCQTGVDEAALAAAKAIGIATGGTMPLGYMTLDGRREDLALEYGLTQSELPGYAARTEQNVKDADATLRIAKTFSSPGEKCTIRAIRRLRKPPPLDINVKALDSTSLDSVVQWLLDNNVHILNVAGNSEDTAPGIYQLSYAFLTDVFTLWLERYAKPQDTQ